MMGDVVGYSRQMEADEDDTYSRMAHIHGEIVKPAIARHQGRVIKFIGDGFLATFLSPAEALACAAEIQRSLADTAAAFPADRRILYRIALNFCDVIVTADDIFGDGVNITSRLQTYAEPGDIAVTAEFAAQAPAAVAAFAAVDLGELHLKNIARPVRATNLRIGSLRNLAAQMPPRTADARPSLAVIPFRRPGRRQSDAYIADAVFEEVIHGLAATPALFVISRGSTTRYRGDRQDPRSVGKALDVRYVLSGAVQRESGRLRILTELTDVESGEIIRHDRFDGAESELFALQEQIAIAVMKSVAPEIQERELRRSMRKRPEHLSAYELVLRALDHLFRLGRDAHAQAGTLLKEAIAIDPGYAPAYAYSAYWHIFRVGEGWSEDPMADARQAARMAQAAIDRDPRDGLALAIFGHVQSFLLRDFETANAILDRAVRDAPNCAMAWTMSSVTRGYLGDCAAAVERAEIGLRLSPLDAHAFWFEGQLAQAHYLNGDYETAVAWARKAAAQNPSAMFNLRVLAASLVAAGRAAAAGRVAGEILALKPDFNLFAYEKACPFTGRTLAAWIDRLRIAGLPDSVVREPVLDPQRERIS